MFSLHMHTITFISEVHISDNTSLATASLLLMKLNQKATF